METCIVGCKLPHGLNVDLLVKKGDKRTGTPDETKRLKLNGANSQVILGGHGVTYNVPKEAFTEWLKAHSRMEFVRNGSVWIVNDAAGARAAATERRGTVTGFEPIDPSKQKGITPEDQKVLDRQRAENPMRGRQVDQLDVDMGMPPPPPPAA